MLRIVSMFMVAAGATTALAQGTGDQRVCMGDAFRLCSAFIPDEAQIETCLESKLASLTPACRAQFDTPASVAQPKAKATR